jgi:Protein of unknown function (DUF3017)
MTPEAATAPELVVKTDAAVAVVAVAPLDVSLDVSADAPFDVSADDALAVAVPVEPQERPRGVLGEIPLALIICGVGSGLVVIALHHFRWGNLLIAGSLLAGAMFRLVLPTRRAGLLAVRARLTDVITMCVMGVGLMVLALVTST